MVGAFPVICNAKEGEFVTEMDEITDSTSTDVFVQLTNKSISQNICQVRPALTKCYRIDLSFYDNSRTLAAIQVDRMA